MSTPFALTRGQSQQRIQVSDAADGSFVFELGHASGGDARLQILDYQEVAQDFVRPAQAAFIAPVVQITPNDFTGMWELTARLNAAVVYRRALRVDVPPMTLHDIMIPLAAAPAAPAVNTLVFRLELVG